jgi:hypothetical protein
MPTSWKSPTAKLPSDGGEFDKQDNYVMSAEKKIREDQIKLTTVISLREVGGANDYHLNTLCITSYEEFKSHLPACM